MNIWNKVKFISRNTVHCYYYEDISVLKDWNPVLNIQAVGTLLLPDERGP